MFFFVAAGEIRRDDILQEPGPQGEAKTTVVFVCRRRIPQTRILGVDDILEIRHGKTSLTPSKDSFISCQNVTECKAAVLCQAACIVLCQDCCPLYRPGYCAFGHRSGGARKGGVHITADCRSKFEV